MPEIHPGRPRRGLCFVLSAPSGTGKTTLTRALLAKVPGLSLSVSATTRAPRPGEIDSVHYYFKTAPEFSAMVTEGALLEWAEVFGHAYGTPRTPVVAALAAGQDILFDIDWQGFRALRAALPGDTVGVFIAPPSLASLQTRLIGRGDPPGQVAERLAGARADVAHWREYDHVVVNEDVTDAVASLTAILVAARCATSRQLWQPEA